MPPVPSLGAAPGQCADCAQPGSPRCGSAAHSSPARDGWSAVSRGRGRVFTTTSATRASGPLVISRMRSASRIASSTSCVIMNAVCPASATSRSTSSCNVPRVSASSALNGSSISSSEGDTASARAIPTRCFIPPDSSAGFRAAASAQPHQLQHLPRPRRHLRPPSSRDAGERTANATLPSAVSHGSSACDWKMTARSSAGPRHLAAVHHDHARIRRLEPGEDVEDRRLAAPGVPDQRHELAPLHRRTTRPGTPPVSP